MRRKQMKIQKKIIIISSLCLLLCLCVGYAAFSTQLSIRAKGNIKETKLAADMLIETVVDTGDGLYLDTYEEGRYIYKGANPNNYITFNNETWRILSVEDDGSLKIIRNESIGNMAWTDSPLNDWNNASLKTYLNNDYLNTITVNKNKIIPRTWSIGNVNSSAIMTDLVASENSTQSQSFSVGLITVSEYLRVSNNAEECNSVDLNNINNSVCRSSNWIYDLSLTNESMYTISARGSGLIYTIIKFGYFDTSGPSNSYGVFPVVYLTPDITLSGAGTVDSPYKIEV